MKPSATSSPTNIKFIYFDIGNIFMTFDNIFNRLSLDLDIDKDKFDKAYDHYDVDANLGIISIPEVWSKLCHQLNIKNGENYNIIESWISDYQAILPMHELAILLEQKYPLGILSNYYHGYYEEATRQGFIPKIKFSPVIISAEVGSAKPQPEIYRIAEDKCGFKGSDIFFIDDKLENIEEASRHCWQTFQFDYKNPEVVVEELKNILLI